MIRTTMEKLVVILTILFPTLAFCQISPVNFKDCTANEFFVNADTQPVWGCDSIGMIDYMNQSVIDGNLGKIEYGKILVGILIYSDGKTCCSSFGNFTKTELNAEKFKEAIDKMPNWLPAKQNGKEIAFLKNQIFVVRQGKFVQN